MQLIELIYLYYILPLSTKFYNFFLYLFSFFFQITRTGSLQFDYLKDFFSRIGINFPGLSDLFNDIKHPNFPWPIFSKLVRKLGTEVWTAVLGSGHRTFQNLVSLPIIKIVVHPNFANYDNDIGKHQRHVTIFVEKCRNFCLFWITLPTK